LAKVACDWFPMGSYKGQRSPGFYMCDNLKETIDLWVKNVKNDWDFVVIISGQGTVRVGKCLHPEVTTIKVLENNEVIEKKLSDFSDGQKVKTVSWDFKNKKEVISESEVMVTEDKDFYEVELENGKKVVCTMEHNLFVRRNFCGTDDKLHHKIIETKLKYLKEGDEIICLN